MNNVIKYIIAIMLTASAVVLRAQTTDVDTIGLTVQLLGTADALDNQTLSLSGNILSIVRGNSVDLSPYLDNTDTDDQVINYLAVDTVNNILYVGIEDGDTLSVSLSGLNLPGLTPQTLSIASDQLSISAGNSVDLSPYLDDTDTQRSQEEIEDFVGAMVDGGTETGITVTYDDGSGKLSFVALDISPTNELYDDTDVVADIAANTSAIASNTTNISTNATNITARVPIPSPCSTGQVLKWTGSAFTCQADAVTGSPDGYISDVILSADSIRFVGVANAVTKTLKYTGWDRDASNDLTTSTTFDGDVTGTYNSLVVTDDSHSHTISTISDLPNIVSSIDGVSNDGGNIDLVAGSNISITPNDGANTITIAATNTTNLSTAVAPSGTYGSDAAWIYSSTGTDLIMRGDTTAGKTRVRFTPATSGQQYISAGVAETDPNVGSHIKAITTTDISNWNAKLTAEVDGSVTNEIQDLSLSGNTLSLSGDATTVDLSPYLDNTVLSEAQVDAYVANNGYLTSEVDGSTTNEIQTLSVPNYSNTALTGATMTLNNGVGAGTTNVLFTRHTTNVTLGNTGANQISIGVTEVDGSVTNEIQDLSLSGNTLSLSGDATAVSLTGANISYNSDASGNISAAATTVQAALDEMDALNISASSDDQFVDQFGIASNILSISLDGDGVAPSTVDLSPYLDNVTRSDEEIQDVAGAMVDGGTQTGITVTYDDPTGKLNFTAADASPTNEIQALTIPNYNDNELTTMNMSLSGTNTITIKRSTSNVRLGNFQANQIEIGVVEGDPSPTNEIQDLSLSGNTLSLSGDATTVDLSPYLDNTVLSEAQVDAYVANNGYITSEVDGSTTNEGALSVGAGTSTTSTISSNTSGSTPVTITAGTGLSISESGNTITLANTGLLAEVDGSISNELQNLSLGARTGTSQPINISNGTGVTIDVADNDNSSTNEIQDLSLSGNTLSLSGDATTVDLSPYLDNTVLSEAQVDAYVANNGYLTSEVDGSTTNEGALSVGAGTSTTSTISSNTSGSTPVTITAGTGLSISESGNTITLANTGLLAEVDGSTTNEGALSVGAGTSTTSTISSNTSGSTPVTITAGTGLSISESGNTITLANTGLLAEVDGSISNELQSLSGEGSTLTLSNSGGSVNLATLLSTWDKNTADDVNTGVYTTNSTIGVTSSNYIRWGQTVGGTIGVYNTGISLAGGTGTDINIQASGTGAEIKLIAPLTQITSGDLDMQFNSIINQSDERLKKDITEIKSLDKINQLVPVKYRYKKNDKREHLGLIAQEVERIYPEIVHTNDEGIKSIAYTELIAPLIRAIQEQQVQINDLQKEIKELKKEK